jgi:hypothetical protein
MKLEKLSEWSGDSGESEFHRGIITEKKDSLCDNFDRNYFPYAL